jgi:hypothetical protein
MVQRIRTFWVFQHDEIMGRKFMDQAMERMKQLVLFAEPIAEYGISPRLKPGPIDKGNTIGLAIGEALEDIEAFPERRARLREAREVTM